MEFVRKNALGILACLVIAVPAWLLGQRFQVVGGPVFAILIGMVIALFWKDQRAAKSGITYTSKKILQLAVVLLGFGMNLGSVLQVGGQSLPIIVSTIATSLIVAYILYKALHMDRQHLHPHRRGLLHLRRQRHRRHRPGHRRRRRGDRPGHLRHLPVQRHRGPDLPHPGRGCWASPTRASASSPARR